MAKSRRPSPLKSAVTITPGWLTMTGDVAVENVPSPFPNRIVTVLSLRFTTARSSSPSLLKSPRTSVKGPCPTGTGEPEAALNVPSPLPSRMLTMFPIPSLTAKRIVGGTLDGCHNTNRLVLLDCLLLRWRQADGNHRRRKGSRARRGAPTNEHDHHQGGAGWQSSLSALHPASRYNLRFGWRRASCIAARSRSLRARQRRNEVAFPPRKQVNQKIAKLEQQQSQEATLFRCNEFLPLSYLVRDNNPAKGVES